MIGIYPLLKSNGKNNNNNNNFVSATANVVWLGTLDMYPIGWSVCPKTNSYLQEFYIDVQSGSSGDYRLQDGKCSAAGLGYTNQPATCTNANWGSTLDG